MEIGDIVHLKSGGPAMTVSHIDAAIPAKDMAPAVSMLITCKWHDETGMPHVERYEDMTLVVKAHKEVVPSGKK